MGYYIDYSERYISDIWQKESLEANIKNAKDTILKAQEYIKKCEERFAVIDSTTIKKIIRLKRNENYYSNKKIIYNVAVYEFVFYKNEKKDEFYSSKDGLYEKHFEGFQRNEAIKYAKELSKKLNYSIVLHGYWNKELEKKINSK